MGDSDLVDIFSFPAVRLHYLVCRICERFDLLYL